MQMRGVAAATAFFVSWSLASYADDYPLPHALPTLKLEHASGDNEAARKLFVDFVTQLIVEAPPSETQEPPALPNVRAIIFFRRADDGLSISQSDGAAASPHNSDAHASRGLEYLAEGNANGAAAEFSVALSENPSSFLGSGLID